MDLLAWFRPRPPARRVAAGPAGPFPPAEAWRPLVGLLAEPLPEPWRSSRWAAFQSELDSDLDSGPDRPDSAEVPEHEAHTMRAQALIEALQHPGEPSWWLALAVDWKDAPEAEHQARAIARTHGVTDDFAWDWTRHPHGRVHEVLEEFERWLEPRGLRWAAWTRVADAYYGFVLRPEQLPAWTELDRDLRLGEA